MCVREHTLKIDYHSTSELEPTLALKREERLFAPHHLIRYIVVLLFRHIVFNVNPNLDLLGSYICVMVHAITGWCAHFFTWILILRGTAAPPARSLDSDHRWTVWTARCETPQFSVWGGRRISLLPCATMPPCYIPVLCTHTVQQKRGAETKKLQFLLLSDHTSWRVSCL